MLNKDFKLITFIDNDFSIDIKFDIEEDTIWMTQKEIAQVFEVSSSNITHLINDLKIDDVFINRVIEYHSVTASDGKQYNTKIYNLEIIILLSYKVRSKRAPKFISWVKDAIKKLKEKEQLEIINSYNNLLHSNKYEIIKFKDGNFEMDINVSPYEETVWLTQEEMSILFDKAVSTINEHITNIFLEGELDENSSFGFSEMRENGRRLKIYNLDVVYAVGMRVKSKRGYEFRKWARDILKDYQIKGFVYNPRIHLEENYIALISKVISLDHEFSIFKKEFSKPQYNIFYKGQFFDSYSFILDIVIHSEKKIIIIDSYLDYSILNYIKKVDKDIQWELITSSKSKLSHNDISIFEKQYFKVKLTINDDFHDRFIIIDGQIVYHIGTSLNYIGKRTFVVSKVNDEDWIKDFLNKLNV